jgi:hypothetical protein
MLVRVALANTMARIVWALMAKGGVYRAPAVAAQAGAVERSSERRRSERYGATVVRRDRETSVQQSAIEHAALIRTRPANTIQGPRQKRPHQRPDRCQHPTAHHADPRSPLRSGRPQMLRNPRCRPRVGASAACLGRHEQAVTCPSPHGALARPSASPGRSGSG